jgi:hypothetical protein
MQADILVASGFRIHSTRRCFNRPTFLRPQNQNKPSSRHSLRTSQPSSRLKRIFSFHPKSTSRFSQLMLEAHVIIAAPLCLKPMSLLSRISPHLKSRFLSQASQICFYSRSSQFLLLCSSSRHLCRMKPFSRQMFLNRHTFSSSQIESLISRDWHSNRPIS